jgi:hypothetical protein
VEEVENNDVGEHEDDDVRTERQKVSDILSNRSVNPPVVVVQVIYDSVTNLGIMMIQNPYTNIHYFLVRAFADKSTTSETSFLYLLGFSPTLCPIGL